MLEISRGLQVNSKLTTLYLLFNNIGVNGAKSLATALCHNHTLEHLIIGYNEIMDDGIIAISECFKVSGGNNAKLTCVKSLDISDNCLTSHSKTAISTIIREGTLVVLELADNDLGESGAYEISKTLQGNLTLQQLDLSSNDIGVTGALSIAVALYNNHILEYLDVSYNEILDDGAIAIAECLKTNRTLKYLNVSYNNITEIGATEIVEVMKINPVLEKLNVDKKWIEIMKPYNEQLLYNETVDRCYHIEVHDPSYQVRVWTNNGVM